MTASSKHHHNQPPSSSTAVTKPSRNNPNSSAVAPPAPPQIANPNPTSSSAAAAATSPITLFDRNHPLSHATLLTRHELLKRRSHHLKQLLQCYKDHYWALMEEVKVQHREYYWKYGVSPIKDDQKHHREEDPAANFVDGGESGNIVEVMDESNNFGSNNNNHNSSKGENELKNVQSSRCKSFGCKLKAMALTSFCHLHILSDPKQKLYKACTFVIKSPPAGPITCGKPILGSTVPCLCTVHYQKAQQHVTRALKKAGLNIASSNKLATKFHVIVAEYVNQIQAKRRAAKRSKLNKEEVKGAGGKCSAAKS
ncbi:INO80 complex subunit D [Linum perenne]